jgi:transcriptional regulator with XRE-family HTH domain
MPLRLAWSKSLSEKRFSATVAPVKSFGSVCRDLRDAAGLSQKQVAEAGGLEQSRVSEIERDKYLPGLDLAVRLAHGLGVTLTDIVSRWEGTATDAGGVPRRVTRRPSDTALDVPQEDMFRRVRGLWELMSPDRRDVYLKQGKTLVAEQWKAEARGGIGDARDVESGSKHRAAVRRAR